MEHSNDEINYIKVLVLVYDCILPKLRELFREKWEREKPTESLKNNIYEQLKNIRGKDDEWLKTSVSNGDPSSWDMTCIFRALSMIGNMERENKIKSNVEDKKKKDEKKREERVKQGAEDADETEKTEEKAEEGKKKQTEESKEKEDRKNIKILKDVRNKLFHWPSREMTNEEKDDIFEIVKRVFHKFSWLSNKIEEIQDLPTEVEDESMFKEMMEEEWRIGTVM